MKSSVESMGYNAVEATNDVEALELAEHDSIDAIVTEEELPTFKTLLENFRNHPTLSNIPIVIVNPDADYRSRLGEAYLLCGYGDITALLADLCR